MLMCPISILSIRSNDTKVVSSWESNPTPHRKGSYVKDLFAAAGPYKGPSCLFTGWALVLHVCCDLTAQEPLVLLHVDPTIHLFLRRTRKHKTCYY